ncbi:MAG: single-stranded DNA-binding protein [Actinomycetes bacterium]
MNPITLQKEEITEADYSVNEIKVIGRFSGPALEKELPSGDKVVEFRLISSREDRDGVDVINVAVWKSQLRKRALTLRKDEWISVEGALRRRFWRSPAGLASRYQVEARELSRI